MTSKDLNVRGYLMIAVLLQKPISKQALYNFLFNQLSYCELTYNRLVYAEL